jgi:hypothetical protein
MTFDILALILVGAAAALAYRRFGTSRRDERTALAPVRVRVERPVRRPRSR